MIFVLPLERTEEKVPFNLSSCRGRALLLLFSSYISPSAIHSAIHFKIAPEMRSIALCFSERRSRALHVKNFLAAEHCIAKFVSLHYKWNSFGFTKITIID
jgi:hypothetical protein